MRVKEAVWLLQKEGQGIEVAGLEEHRQHPLLEGAVQSHDVDMLEHRAEATALHEVLQAVEGPGLEAEDQGIGDVDWKLAAINLGQELWLLLLEVQVVGDS